MIWALGSRAPSSRELGGRALGGSVFGGGVFGGSVFGGQWAIFHCVLWTALAAAWPEAGSLRGAEFGAERRVTDGTGLATQTATGLDVANNAYISSVSQEKISVRIIGPTVDAAVPITADGLGQGDPDFATSSRGVTYMTFSQLEAGAVEEDKEIFLTNNEGGGGQFAPPVKLSDNRVEDYAPRLVLDYSSRPHLVWAQQVGNVYRVIYWRHGLPGDLPVVVGLGNYPHLYVSEAGVVHVAYIRDNDLWYASDVSGTFGGELRITTTARDPEAAVSIGGDPQGNILVTYESRSTLYFANKPLSNGFLPPLLLDTGGVLHPRMRVRSRGQVAIVYEKQGDIHYIVGQSTFLVPPAQITSTPEAIETHPSLEVDLLGNLHVSYIRGGEVYYRNNVEQPSVEFSGVPTRGEVPLTVSFGDLSTGQLQTWDWDFGDGATTNEQNPTHTYTVPGKYTVRLRVAGPGGREDTREKVDFIFVQDPYYTMRVPDQRVIPGQEDVWFPVITTRKERIQGFQLMGLFDPNFLVLQEFVFNYTPVAALSRPPEFYQLNDRGTFFEVGCVFEFEPPIDEAHQFIQPAEKQPIIYMIFDISSSAPQGARTRLDLVNDNAISRIFNIFTVDGFTKLPALTGSTIEILVLQAPFPKLFLRGDTDGDNDISITDAIRILGFLFAGGEPPRCLDTADFNDSGRVDISSAVALLNYLFLGGSPPPVPFPNLGLDPTADDQPECK